MAVESTGIVHPQRGNVVVCDLKLGYSCNNRCVHCVIAGDRQALQDAGMPQDLSTAEWQEALSAYASAGVDRVVLTGGEVTIRPDFLEIVRCCAEHGFAVGIQTNGRRFALVAVCDAVAQLEDVGLTVALHAATASVHDGITRARGSFNETIRGIRNLRELGKAVTLKVVMSKLNAGGLTGILDLASELRVRSACFAFPHALGDAWRYFDVVVPRYCELEKELAALAKRAYKLAIEIEFEAVPLCVLGQYAELASELHDLGPFVRLYKPVGRTTLDWDQTRRSIKRKGLRCGACLYSLICEGCWMEYIERFGDAEFVPVMEVTETTTALLARAMRITS